MNARSSHALTALPLLALALVAAPVVAQEVAPPPVTATQAPPTTPAPQTVTPPPVVATAPAPTSPSAAPTSGGSATAIDPQAAANAAAEQAQRRPAIRSARTSSAPPAAAPARSAPAAAVTPPSATPAPAAETPAAATTPAPASPVADEQAPAAAAPARDRSIWPWLIAALAVVGIVAGLVMWRRRRAREEAWEETAYTTEPAYADAAEPEPAYAPEPLSAARPVAAAAAAPAMLDRTPTTPVYDAPLAAIEEASVARADSDDVKVLTAAAPVGDRPWLELAMRPVRAGTTEDDARVEIELTVGNAGPVDAEEVHVSAFMLADPDDGEIERMLVAPRTADAVEPLRIGAGEGARVDAALTLPRASLASEARFRPVVIAEARYRLPDGSEGRTAASFEVGMVGDPDAPLAPVTTAGTEMRDDVEARLHRAAEHA